jgi:hypothetical protein
VPRVCSGFLISVVVCSDNTYAVTKQADLCLVLVQISAGMQTEVSHAGSLNGSIVN